MKKYYYLFCAMLLTMLSTTAFAQVIPESLTTSGYYYITSAYNQIPEGEQYALTANSDLTLTISKLDKASDSQIWYIEVTDNGNGSPRFRLYTEDKVNGIQGTTNNNLEQITTIESTTDIPALCSMRQGTIGYTIAVNNRVGKMLTPNKVEDGQAIWMAPESNNLENENTTCHQWTFERISDEKWAELDPDGYKEYLNSAIFTAWDNLAALGTAVTADEVQAYSLTGKNLPGFYPEDLAAEYNNVMVWANYPNEIDLTDAALVDSLTNLFTNLYDRMKNGMIKVTDGYYYLVDAYDELNALGLDPEKTRTEYAAYALDEAAGWAVLDSTNTKMVWKFEQNADGLWNVTNFQTGKYLHRSPSNGRLCTMSTEQDYPIGIGYGAGEGRIELNSNNDSGWKYYARLNPDQPQLECGNRNNYFSNETGRYWYLYPISEETIQKMQQDVENELKAYAFAEVLQDSILSAKTAVLAAYVRNMDNAVEVTPATSEDFDSNAGQSVDHGLSWDDATSTCKYGSDGQGFDALIDDNNSTYFHTASNQDVVEYTYDEQGNVTTAPGLPSLMMKLTEPVNNVCFAFYRRENAGDWATPNTIDVSVSNDGLHWTVVTKPYSLYDAENYDNNNPTVAGPFSLGGDYQYIRFRSYSSRRHTGNNNFFNLGGLKVYRDVVLDPACQAATMNAAVVNELAEALGEASYEAKDNTWANYEDLQNAAARLEAARLAFLAEFADPTVLNNTLANANTFRDRIYIKDGQVGAYPSSCQAALDVLDAAISDGQALLAAGSFTKVQLDEVSQKISDAIAAFSGDYQLPETNKWYQIQFGSEAEWTELGWDVLEPRNLSNRNDALVDDPDNIETVWNLFDRVAAVQAGPDAEDVDFGYGQEPLMDVAGLRSADATLLIQPELSYFRFVPVDEDGTYALQNKTTGLYVGQLPHGTNAAPVSLTPSLFRINPVGGGFVTLLNYDAQGNYLNNTLHFQRDSYAVTGWGDNAGNTKSAVHVYAVADVDENEDITVVVDGTEDEPQAYVLPNGVKQAGDGDTQLYTLSGQYTKELDVITASGETVTAKAMFLGFKQVESVPAGVPFLATGTEYAFLTIGNEFAPAPVASGTGMVGTYAQYTAQEGECVLNMLNNTYFDNYVEVEINSEWSVVSANMPGELTRTVIAGGAYIPSIYNIPEMNEDDADISLLVVSYDDSAYPDADLEDGISQLPATSRIAGGVYNMAGQKVADTLSELRSLRSGLYIINGKKVIVNK